MLKVLPVAQDFKDLRVHKEIWYPGTSSVTAQGTIGNTGLQGPKGAQEHLVSKDKLVMHKALQVTQDFRVLKVLKEHLVFRGKQENPQGTTGSTGLQGVQGLQGASIQGQAW